MSSLEDSVRYVLHARGEKAEVTSVGGSVIVRGPEPLGVAAELQHLPGVSWIAVGFVAGTSGELARAGESVARTYLRPRDRFSVEAEATGGALASDIGGAITSKILGAVRGARVSESPRVRFRAAADGRKGAVGVEVRKGAGGVPTGSAPASCLVSGGIHSSVAAWLAVLAGLRVRLVHAKVSDESLLAVARLYSELSNRADPRGLSLEVLEGGPVDGMIAEYASHARVEVFGGFAAGRAPPQKLREVVSSPLHLMPEESYKEEFESLGVKPFDETRPWGQGGTCRYTSKSFSGGPVDVSAVLDGLG